MTEPAEQRDQNPADTSADVAEYIADLVEELQALASGAGHIALADMLALAKREAQRSARPDREGSGGATASPGKQPA